MQILSKITVSKEETFKNIALSALNAKLFFCIVENAFVTPNLIELNIQKNVGKKNNESFLMDIIPADDQLKDSEISKIIINGELFYKLAGTSDSPYSLCYDFCLSYLKLCPYHLINMNESLFSLEDMEIIEKKGYFDMWWLRPPTVRSLSPTWL